MHSEFGDGNFTLEVLLKFKNNDRFKKFQTLIFTGLPYPHFITFAVFCTISVLLLQNKGYPSVTLRCRVETIANFVALFRMALFLKIHIPRSHRFFKNLYLLIRSLISTFLWMLKHFSYQFLKRFRMKLL